MKLPISNRLVMIVFMLLVYFSGYYLIKYFIMDEKWIYLCSFWLGVIYHIFEVKLSDKFTEIQLNKLRYFAPKT